MRVWLCALVVGCSRPPASSDTGVDPGTTPALPLRVLTWNLESLGDEGTAEHTAVLEILTRLDADVVALNEVDGGEEEGLHDLAASLGYDTVVVPDTNPFGDLKNAILTRLPLVAQHVWTSDALSADPAANDLTRWPVSVDVESGGATVRVVVQHWKSGFEVIDDFRRIVDGTRAVQGALQGTVDLTLLVGDVNAELDEPPFSPSSFETLPAGAPSGFVVGDDLQAAMDAGGIPNDPFLPVFDAQLEVVDALQLDGRDGTRDESGRRLDHVFVSDLGAVTGSEVYDTRDDGDEGLPKLGEAPDRDRSAEASDHFPVVVDLAP